MTKIYEFMELSIFFFKEKNPNSVEGISSNSDDSGWALLGCSLAMDDFQKLKVTFTHHPSL